MKNFLFYLIIGLLAFCSVLANASSLKSKPGQKSTSCFFNDGPKSGQTEDLKDKMPPTLIAKPCADGLGNTGMVVVSKEDEAAEEAEEAEEAAKAQKAAGATINKPEGFTACKIFKGAKKGETVNLLGKILPLSIGNPCTDGEGNIGSIIAD